MDIENCGLLLSLCRKRQGAVAVCGSAIGLGTRRATLSSRAAPLCPSPFVVSVDNGSRLQSSPASERAGAKTGSVARWRRHQATIWVDGANDPWWLVLLGPGLYTPLRPQSCNHRQCGEDIRYISEMSARRLGSSKSRPALASPAVATSLNTNTRLVLVSFAYPHPVARSHLLLKLEVSLLLLRPAADHQIIQPPNFCHRRNTNANNSKNARLRAHVRPRALRCRRSGRPCRRRSRHQRRNRPQRAQDELLLERHRRQQLLRAVGRVPLARLHRGIQRAAQHDALPLWVRVPARHEPRRPLRPLR
ncbi:hypothetical protein HDK77DRAFT_258660 [Phyllosticta capitalensis]